jgi:hypothetical protein
VTTSKLGIDTTTNDLVYLSQSARRQGLYIIGSTGTGKSGLIENLIIQDITQGLGVCLLDPHGDLSHAVLARIPSDRENDVIFLDIAESDYPFGLNLFTCTNPLNPVVVSEASSKVMHVFKKLWGKGGIVVEDAWGVLLEEMLRNATMTFLEASKNTVYTMAEIPILLENEKFRKLLVQSLTNRHVKNYWTNKYDQLSEKDQREERRSTLNRVSSFLTQPLVEYIVGQAETTIDFRKIMDERKILLIKLNKRLEDVTALIGSMVIAELLNAAYSREEIKDIKKRKQFNVYADEFQNFATEDFATLLTEARKFGIGTTIAHQTRDQLDVQNRSTTLNVANLVVFKISGKDAEELAGEFDATPPEPLVINQRAILSPKQDVVDHLKKNGHVNPLVSQFVNDYLIPALRVIDANKSTFYQIRVSPRLGEPSSKIQMSDLDEACHQLNRLFFSVMTDRDAQKPIPPIVFFQFAKLFGFSKGFAWYFTRWSVWNGSERPSIFSPKDELRLICAPDYLTHTAEIAQKISPDILPTAIAFITSLRQTMQVLASDPILIDTGQHEPIYDKPRTYADVQNQTASTLANLPKYTARVKIIGSDDKSVEHTVKTLEPERGFRGIALQDRLDRIRENNIRDGYLRERVKVEEEITSRQKQCFDLPQEPPDPPSRRKPL